MDTIESINEATHLYIWPITFWDRGLSRYHSA
jgi:hypothetical protein